MASENGYITLDQVRKVPRIEEDVEVEGLGKFLVQNITHEEARIARSESRISDTQIDVVVKTQYEVAFGLLRPDLASLMADPDTVHEALEIVKGLHPSVVAALASKINEISFIESAEAFRRFFTTATSRTGWVAGRSSISSSAQSSTSPPPASSIP